MTATLSEDCTSITVDSANFAADNISVELTLTLNDTTEYTVEVDASNVDPVVVDAAALDIDELSEGVYYVELVITDASNEIITEGLCVASICSLHCDMIELYDDVDNIEKILAYEALKISSDCVTCSCSVMQNLYNKVTDSEDDTNCNCQ